MEQEVETVDVRHREDLHVTANPIAEMALEALRGQRLQQLLIRGVVEREDTDIHDVSLVAGARVRDVFQLHAIECKTNERTFTFFMRSLAYAAPKPSSRSALLQE